MSTNGSAAPAPAQAPASAPSSQPAPAPAPRPAAPRATLDNFHELISHNMREPAPQPSQGRAQRPPPSTPPPAPEPASQPMPEPEGPPDSDPGNELPPDEQGDAQDTSDLLESLFHGKSGREILAAIAKGELPAELLTALKGLAKVNGQDFPVTFQEALAGYQRSVDYTNSKKEIRQLEARANETLEGVHGMIDGWEDGGSILRDFEKLGKMKGFHKAALAYADHVVQNDRLQRENPEAYRQRQLAVQAQRRAAQLEEQLRRAPNPAQEREYAESSQQVTALLGPAFQRHALPDLPQVRDHFAQAFRAIHREGSDLAQSIETAAESTAQLLGDLAARYHGEQSPQANGNGANPRNPSPLPGRPGAPQSTGRPAQHAKQMNIQQMEDHLRSVRRQGR
jgi:hypothetical protein